MAQDEVPITHATLNQLPQTHRTQYLRRILISAGTLPPIDIYLNGYEIFAEDFIASRPAAQAAVLRKFHRWHILRSMRQRSMITPTTSGAGYSRRRELRRVSDLLAWLSEQNLTLEDANQGHLDHYFAHVSHTPDDLASFITWCRRTRLTQHLTAPARKSTPPQELLSEEDRWAAISLLLSDDSIPPDARLIGLFLLIYAQPITTSTRLKRSAVRLYDETVTITFAEDPIELPPPLADLTRHFVEHHNARVIYTAREREWLFEGLMPTTHVTASAISLVLSKLGIPIRKGKSSALRQLTTAIPARVIQDTLGLSAVTASRWARQSGRTWSDYPKLRE